MTASPSTASKAETTRSAAMATLPATAALTVLTVVTAAGMGRLFNSTSYLGPVVGAAVGAHALAWLWRRLGVRSAAALLLSAAGVLLVTTWVALPHTTVLGLPSGTTFNQMASQLSQARQQLQELTTPAPVTTGFLLGSALIVGIVAVLGDWAAFRHRSTLEATVPSLALFIYTAALGTSRGRTLAVAIYLAALIGFVLVSESSRRASTMPWLTSRARRGLTPLLRGGATLGVIAVAAALVVGPNLPGARSAAAVDLRHLTQPGPSQRTTISPLVDIRSQLVKPTDVELFTVASTTRTYWRLTSLDTFDGAIWSANQSYRTAGVELPSASAAAPAGVAPGVKQAFSISNLASVWAPAAYRPSRLVGIPNASYNPESGSIITPSATPDGLTYQVTSDVPHLDGAELTQDGTVPAGTDVAHYLALPGGIPESIRQTAAQIVRGQTTDYGKSLALQNWFRDNFRYNLNVPPGHDDNAMLRFLSARQGYCEQFAGTYAVMARSIGLPTRVAVGFTPGQVAGDAFYHVRALNAHAWPEVLLGRYGWVSFEPTPGRGEPGAEAYTGVAAAQAGPTDTPPQSTTGTSASPAPTTPAPLPTPKPQPNVVHAGPTVRHAGHFPLTGVAALGVVVLLALAWVVGIPLLARRRRQRRRAAARGPDRVMVAWAEAADSLALMGVGRQPSETLQEHARRAAGSRVAPSEVPPALSTLAQDASVASYAAGPLGTEVVSRSVVAAAVIEGAVWNRATRWQRLRWRLDPRQLFRASRHDGGWNGRDPERRGPERRGPDRSPRVSRRA
ncbi:MAG: transglutaminase domain-containing protein [Actinobacteria bacterium]|nr:MAG: transglutaminase domain-containing protein [Actinomycetota bacterium]